MNNSICNTFVHGRGKGICTVFVLYYMIRSTRIVYTLYRSRFLKTIKFFTHNIYKSRYKIFKRSRFKGKFLPSSFLPSSPFPPLYCRCKYVYWYTHAQKSFKIYFYLNDRTKTHTIHTHRALFTSTTFLPFS